MPHPHGTRDRTRGKAQPAPAAGRWRPCSLNRHFPQPMQACRPLQCPCGSVPSAPSRSIRISSSTGIQRIASVPMPGDVRRLLNPGVRLFRAVARRRVPSIPLVRTSHPRLRLPRSKKADEVRHVTAADKQASTIHGITQHLGDPANRLPFDFARHRRKQPRSNIGVDCGGQQLTQCADGRSRRSDVSPEARMAIEERVIEEQVSGMMEQLRRIGALLRQSALGCESMPYVGGRLRRVRAGGEAIQESRRCDR